MTPQGTLIGIDGPDGSGKETQTKLLVERIEREIGPAVSFSFPDYDSWTGKIIRAVLDGAYGDPAEMDPYVCSHYFTADRFRASPDIKAKLESGANVVLNRWKAANDGHQGGKIADPEARERFWRWGYRLEYGVNGMPRPVISVYLSVPIEVSLGLIAKRAAEKGVKPDGHENRKHLEAAIRSYRHLANFRDDFVFVDCGTPDGKDILSKEVIHDMIWEIVKPYLVK